MSRRILVVEDQPKVLAVIRRRLEGAGYRVTAALDGAEGLKRARSEKPDLIVLDLILPDISGYEVCRQLKQDRNCRRIPVVMLTARAQQKDIEEGMRVGAEAYITKPYRAAVLLARIAEILSSRTDR